MSLFVRLLRPFLGALLLAVLANSPSSAAIVTIVFDGKATGADSAGIFFAPNTSFSAVNFSASTTFDTATPGALTSIRFNDDACGRKFAWNSEPFIGHNVHDERDDNQSSGELVFEICSRPSYPGNFSQTFVESLIARRRVRFSR